MTDWRCVGHPPLALRVPQHERPRSGEGFTLTLTLSRQGRGDWTPHLVPQGRDGLQSLVDGAVFAEGIDFVPGVAELVYQDLFGVLAHFGGCTPGLYLALAEL